MILLMVLHALIIFCTFDQAKRYVQKSNFIQSEMKALLQRALTFLFRHTFPFKIFEKAKDEWQTTELRKRCEADDSVQFFQETSIFNQRERSRIQIGEGSCVRGEILLFNYGKQITLGKHVYIGGGTRIWAGSTIHIGDNVLIAHNCNIIGSNSHEMDAKKRSSSYQKLLKEGHPRENPGVVVGEISIGDYAWISFNVTILKNVSIGEGAIVASDSLVLEDVPPYTLVGGSPAKVIKKLKEAE